MQKNPTVYFPFSSSFPLSASFDERHQHKFLCPLVELPHKFNSVPFESFKTCNIILPLFLSKQNFYDVSISIMLISIWMIDGFSVIHTENTILSSIIILLKTVLNVLDQPYQWCFLPLSFMFFFIWRQYFWNCVYISMMPV